MKEGGREEERNKERKKERKKTKEKKRKKDTKETVKMSSKGKVGVFLTVNHRRPLPLRELHSTDETLVWRDPGGS